MNVISAAEVELLSEEGAKDILRRVLSALDDLDEEDFFGTEGWRHYLQLDEGFD